MGYIRTNSTHRVIRTLFKRRKRITVPQVLAELITLQTPGSGDDLRSRMSFEHWIDHHILACEVVLGRLISAGCVYPIWWRACLEKYPLFMSDFTLFEVTDAEVCSTGMSIDRVLKAWTDKAPPWLDRYPRRIDKNRDWLACIDVVIDATMDRLWLGFEHGDTPTFVAGRTFDEHPLIEGEDL